MDDDREKTTEKTKAPAAETGATAAPAGGAGPAAPIGAPAGAAAASPPGSVHDVPDLEVSPQMRRAMAEAEAAVCAPAQPAEPRAAGPVEPQAFDPNRPPAPAEPPPHEPSKKEMELKMQILDLRQQLREKDKEIEQRLKEVKQNAEQARMLQSQLEGYKVRAMKEKADWFNYGHEPILKELLQVVDNLERALAHGAKDTDPAAICSGVELIQRQLVSLLGKFGATPLDSRGQPFNPELHQAMSQVEKDDVPTGTVVEEFQKGYRLKDRLLRPAMVLVSRKSAAAVEAAPAGDANDRTDKDSAGGD